MVTAARNFDPMDLTLELDAPIAWVADDDPEMVALLRDYLDANGFFVETFANGEELANALWFVVEKQGPLPPDLIVTDVYMPGPTGIDVMAMLRRSDWQIPVVVITGDANVEVRSKARRLGAREVLQKPFDLKDFGHLALLEV